MPVKPKHYVEWISPTPPPAAGYMIHGRMYKFLPNDNFNGRRIELVAANNITKTCRFHFHSLKQVDILDANFKEEQHWSWIKQNRGRVQSFLDMLGEDPEERKTQVPVDDEDGEEDGDGERFTLPVPDSTPQPPEE